ncbi:hypothetical protein E0H22_10505 [Rhodopseudomonas boonkerdii]|uniref:hypothetical protein n=1 Tax=Rhodopseudomonas boonkerdii TaxID=475937 RepID=UPI001E646AF6|nr:hypothetical protein [Rhodopseudomonas boonkerdii]UGV26083.1 hypothetical protein E0H22_10505 [Rhodopseudomonas boonkerdii]
MARTSKARPAEKPARASSLDGDAIEGDDAEARRLAGIALRKKTVAATMVYAGLGLRASDRALKLAAKKPAARKPAASKTPAATPSAKTPRAAASLRPAARKRLRTHSQFIQRIADTIAGQLDQIDAITRAPGRSETGPSEAERHARTVAALARVAAELRKEREADRRRADDDHRSADSDRPRDLDELRERLSRRLEARLGRGSAVPVGDDAAVGTRLPD